MSGGEAELPVTSAGEGALTTGESTEDSRAGEGAPVGKAGGDGGRVGLAEGSFGVVESSGASTTGVVTVENDTRRALLSWVGVEDTELVSGGSVAITLLV